MGVSHAWLPASFVGAHASGREGYAGCRAQANVADGTVFEEAEVWRVASQLAQATLPTQHALRHGAAHALLSAGGAQPALRCTQALKFCHANRILHLDIKAQNVFIVNGDVRLGDFGLAKHMKARPFAHRAQHLVCCLLHLRAPEAARPCDAT
jgi:serine/threonine protein kinase